MRKNIIFPIILSIVAVMLIAIGISKSFASVIYQNYSDGQKMYIKSSSDTSNGSAITNDKCEYMSVSPYGDFIYYSNNSFGGKLYKKSSSDTLNGNQITSVGVIGSSASPDGQYVVYANSSDGELYKKSSSDDLNGSAITSGTNARYPKYSPDGQYVVYVNLDDGQKLYKKSSSDTSNGSAITSVSSSTPSISPDGQYIIYTNSSAGSVLYKKSFFDTSNGSAITSSVALQGVYSKDGQYIIYSNASDGQKLYKKSSSDTSNGSAITSVISTFPVDFDIGSPPSCTDGIKNQDESGVDFGGVCGGTDTFIHDGPYEENFLCTNVNIVNPPTTGSGYDFGTLASLSEDHFYPSTWTFDFYSGSTEEDYFEATGLGSGTLIYSGSLKSLDAGITSTLLPLDPSSQYSIQLNMFSIRNDEYRKVGYIAFKTGKNTQNQGSITFIDENRQEQRTYLVGIGNGVAMGYVVGDFIPKEVKLTGLASPFVFSGMEIGYASETYTQAPQCDNTEWSCKVTGKLGEYCTAQYYPGNARGTCGFVDGYCQPTTSMDDADWSYVGSGTGVTSNYTATSTGESVNSSFSFSFGTLPGVGTGTDCSDMFDGLRFLYGSKSTTTMTLALSNGFKLSETPWTCSFLGADICGVAYDTSDYIVGSMFSAIDSTVNYLFTPVRMGIGYFSKPVQGDRYCFLTSSFTYDGKPATYYDYYLKETVTIGGQNTAFDWVVILIVTSVIFIILFK